MHIAHCEAMHACGAMWMDVLMEVKLHTLTGKSVNSSSILKGYAEALFCVCTIHVSRGIVGSIALLHRLLGTQRNLRESSHHSRFVESLSGSYAPGMHMHLTVCVIC